MELNDGKMEALKQALIGVKNQREVAFILLTSVPEEYLPDMVETLRILNGIEKINSPH
jgi:hypothetical protein